MKLSTLSLALAGVASMAAGSAHAALVPSTVSINPDSAGGDPTLTVAVLDWNTGNTIAIPLTSVSGAAALPTVGDQFQVFAQTNLSSFNGPAPNQSIGGLQLNGPTAATNYEWTFVAAFVEEVVSVSGNTIETKAVTGVNNEINFFQIYFDDSPDANALAGTGYNDGTLILSGSIAATTTANAGSFTVSGGGVGTPLDAALTNDYPAISSITGTGSLALVINVNLNTLDKNFFLDDLIALALNFSTQQALNFQQSDPSVQFWNGSGFVPGATIASIGTCNGCVQVVDGVPTAYGTNNMFQLDPNNSFLVEKVPEPATLALLGLGLAGVGFATRRRKVC